MTAIVMDLAGKERYHIGDKETTFTIAFVRIMAGDDITVKSRLRVVSCHSNHMVPQARNIRTIFITVSISNRS